jgi:hypothetical protein
LEEAKIYFAAKTDTGKLRSQQTKKANETLKLMNIYFNIDELHDLCFELQVDFDNLPCERKIDKIKGLVGLFYRQNLLDVLVNWLEGVKPNVNWPENDITPID